MSSSNMYRIGDYVYFENSSSNPYLVRRIEELNKTSNGSVEAKVICFYRRRDISNSLLLLADKHAKDMEEDMDEESINLSSVKRHQLNHKELYLSRQLDTLPATLIRGKCSVTLLNETESLKSYIAKEDTFFYSLVYDPAQKTLLADKGEIRVGPRHQAEVPPLLKKGEPDPRDVEELEELCWDVENPLTEEQIDRFLIISRSVGTFSRALDCSNGPRQPALHISAASASRDITAFHAMDCLHRNHYSVADAASALVPHSGPVLCKDEMEDWSSSEANLFEEALEKYGKDFIDIRQDFLPWKSLASVVEYYYMWKTSDRYIQQKRLKAVEAENKLKQVYIPNFNKPNPNQIKQIGDEEDDKPCEGCFCTSSFQWFTWGPPNMNCRLCASCWVYWKKYGGLKMPPSSRLERINVIKGTDKELRYRPPSSLSTPSTGGPRTQRASHKTKQAFYLNATRLTRLARRLCHDMLAVRHFSRRPFQPISIAAIKAECQVRLENTPPVATKVVSKKWRSLSKVVEKIAALPSQISQSTGAKKTLLHKALGERSPQAGHRPTKRPLQNGRMAATNGACLRVMNATPQKKRCLESNGTSDDVVFVSTAETREIRRQLKASEQRSAARRPTKLVIPTTGGPTVMEG